MSIPAADLEVLKSRQAFSERKLKEIEEKLQKNVDLPPDKSVSIYITGSYGRAEASEFSDLDIFFVCDTVIEKAHGTKVLIEDAVLTNVEKALMDASVIRTCREMGLPEFTKGGIYLKVNYIMEMLSKLGSQHDDYENLFTARMLLLLESVPILNHDVFSRFSDRILGSYFRDYHDHETSFLPVFLVNDIHRYWKTMCLNYEHSRNRGADVTEVEKNKAHLKNLKLKFSRMLLCYSAILGIMALPEKIDQSAVREVLRQRPLDRIERLRGGSPVTAKQIDELLKCYAWFMQFTGRSEPEVLGDIANRARRNEAFERARAFGGHLYDIVMSAVPAPSRLRYLVI